MDIRPLTSDYAVSPQIAPADLPQIRAAGYTCVICNRPDSENPLPLQSAAMAQAARDAGLDYVYNPVTPGALSDENVRIQRETLPRGKVLAYCASGNRSSVVWSLAQAGRQSTDSLIETARRYGYDLEPFRARIDGLAQG